MAEVTATSKGGNRRAFALALVFLCGCPTSVVARDSKVAVAKPQSAEILVTARQRTEALSDATLPVSILDGRTIFESGVNTLDRLAERFPALTVQTNSTGNLLFIRGVGNFTLLANSDPAVGWNYDGVFIARPIGTNGNLFDLDRVEVLKGPQGVLHGRNASAGTVKLIPRHPVAGQDSVRASTSFGSFDALSIDMAMNLALGTNGAVRIAGNLSEQDNYLDGYTKGPAQQGLRFQLSVELTPDVSLRMASDYTHLGGIGVGTTYLGNYLFDAETNRYRFISSNLSSSKGIYSPEAQVFRQTIFVAAAGRRLDSLTSVPRQNHEFYGSHAELVADFGFATLTTLPAWRRSEIDAVVSGSPFGFRQIETNEQFSLEARLAGRAGPVEWIAGTYLFDDETALANPNSFSTSYSFSKQDYETRSRAVFAHFVFSLGAGMRVGGGARYTRDRKRFNSATTTFAVTCQRRVNSLPSCPEAPLFQLYKTIAEIPFPVPASGQPPVALLSNGVPTGTVVSRAERISKGRSVDKATTWRVSLEKDFSHKGLIYASMETGYRPGGFNTATGFETYEPEQIDAYTAGMRSRWLNDRLSFDLELFWWNYKNQQASSVQPDLSTPPRNVNFTRNIGGSRMRGLEAEVGWEPTLASSLNVVVQYLDAEYSSFEYVQANIGVPPLTGCPFTFIAATNRYTVNCSNQRPYNTPRWSIGLGARQTVSFGPVRATFAANTSYRSSQTIGFTFLPEQEVPGYWTSNAQLILTDRAERFELAAFVRNVEGDRTPNFVIFHPTNNAVVAGTVSPRTFGLRVGISF